MGWVISIGVVCLIIWMIKLGAEQAKMQHEQDTAFAAAHKGWDFYISPYARSVLALNREASQIALGPITNPKQYNLADVAQIEVLRDGASVTSTNRGSQLAGAAIGGLALGGVGLLLGGLSGSKKNQSTVHTISIKVIVDDRDRPVHIIEFFKSAESKGTDSRSSLVKVALERVDHYHALLVNALRTQYPSPPATTTAGELERLWSLKQSGALTDEEFAAQKTRVLGASEAQRGVGAG